MNQQTTQVRMYAKILMTFSFVFSCFFLAAQTIFPSEKNTLLAHLTEVNQEWTKQQVVDLQGLMHEVSFENDLQRIQLHLQLVEKILRKKDTAHLNKSQKSNRLHHLDILQGYWQNGVFPKNSFHKKRQPYFVDQAGTACAVGHLVLQDGQQQLVQQIQKENNYAYIATLQKAYPQLGEWAYNNGFTIDELAWIQPGYPPATYEWNQVGNDGGTDGKINVMQTSYDGSLLYMAGDFSEVDGVAANSIIAWDGDAWHTLGAGVTGEIFDMTNNSFGHLLVVGNFVLNSDSQYSNIAKWDGENWIGLQKGDMEGSVFTVADGGQYIGGDFQKVNNESLAYIAKINYTGGVFAGWTNDATVWDAANGESILVENALSVNGPVKSLQPIGNRILVGGHFTQTASDATHPIMNQLTTNYLSYWNHQNWEVAFGGANAAVEAAAIFDGILLSGGNVADENPIGLFIAGFWEYPHIAQLDEDEGDGLVHGFLEFKDRIYAYGDIKNIPIIGTYSRGFVELNAENDTWNGGGAIFDKTVRAAAVFQDHVYFAGDFTEVNNGWNGATAFNGLTFSALEIPTSADDPPFFKNEIQVYSADNQLFINYKNLETTTVLRIFNLQGQFVKTVDLPKGDENLVVDISEWSAGAYVFQIQNSNRKETGKFMVF